MRALPMAGAEPPETIRPGGPAPQEPRPEAPVIAQGTAAPGALGTAGTALAGQAHGLRDGAAGALFGVNLAARGLALAGLAFAGGLAPGAPMAAVLILASGLVTTLVMMGQRGLPMSIGAAQDLPLALLLPVLFTLGAPGVTAAVPTAFAIIGLTGLAMGALMLLLAKLRLGRVVRLIPHPVAAGFLAASGALIAMAALRLAIPGGYAALPGLAAAGGGALMPLWLSLGFAAALLALMRWLGQTAGLIAGLAAGCALFYGWAAAAGMDAPAARAAGLLPPLTPEGPLRLAWPMAGADWGAAAAQAPVILAAGALGALGLILNTAGLELATRQEIEGSRLLRRTGATSLAGGLIGMPPGYLSLVMTAPAHAMGIHGRAAAVGVCLVLAAAALGAGRLLPLLPVFVLAGLPLAIGLGITGHWLIARRRIETRADWLLTAAIVVIALFAGAVPAVLFGIAAASMIFAVSYASLPVVLRSGSLRAQRSTVDRGPGETALLDARGDLVWTVTLQGYLFFGSIEKAAAEVRRLLVQQPVPRRIILDFSRVAGMDAAAVSGLARLEQLAARSGTRLVLAALPEAAARALDRNGLASGTSGTMTRAASADAALEAAEEALLAAAGPQEDAGGALAQMIGDAETSRRLLSQMERRTLPAGTQLIAAGEEGEDIFVLDQGRLSVQTTLPNGQVIRLRALRPGALAGEIASYAGIRRTADVYAAEDSVVYVITPARLQEVLRDDPALAAAWHRAVAVTLASRVERATQQLRNAR